MAIIQKTIPYEILLRFSHGAEHQKARPGELEGAQFIEMEVFQDDETGKVLNHKIGEAQVLPPEKVAAHVGDQFLNLEAQIRGLKQTIAEMEKVQQETVLEANKQIASRDAVIKMRAEQLAKIAEAHLAVVQA